MVPTYYPTTLGHNTPLLLAFTMLSIKPIWVTTLSGPPYQTNAYYLSFTKNNLNLGSGSRRGLKATINLFQPIAERSE